MHSDGMTTPSHSPCNYPQEKPKRRGAICLFMDQSNMSLSAEDSNPGVPKRRGAVSVTAPIPPSDSVSTAEAICEEEQSKMIINLVAELSRTRSLKF